MRLHRLGITAFGPFAEPQHIDFDELSSAGLFLLHGPTGAGKTSVLDALCFAVYGRVPGHRGTAGRYRSDHADPAVRSEVVCEFTVSGRRLEVTRSPEWHRPKKRGKGFTREQAHVVVREWVADGWVSRTNRMDEAGDLIGQLIGLGPEQFTKLILLPQGEFAAFLQASAEERRPLLQKLFGTDRFAAVESWLGDRRRESAGSVTAARNETARLFARAEEARLEPAPAQADHSGGQPPASPGHPTHAQATDSPGEPLTSIAGSPDPQATPAPSQPATAPGRPTPAQAIDSGSEPPTSVAGSPNAQAAPTPGQPPTSPIDAPDLADTEAVATTVRRWATEAQAERHTAHATVTRAEAAHEKARGEYESVAETVRLRDRRRELSAEHDLLVSQALEQASRKARLQAAGHAPVLLPLLDELGAASTEVETAELRAGSAQQRFGDRPRPDLGQLRQEQATLGSLLPAEVELHRLDQQSVLQREQVQQAEAQRLQAEKAGARLNEQAEKLLAARAESEVLASSVADRDHDLERAKKVAEAVLRAQRLAEGQTGLEDTLRAVTDVHQAAVAASQELQARRLAGMASELAAQLGRNEECPVCGSLDHPRRAKHRGRPVTEEEQERAAQQEAQTEARREQARQFVEAGRQELAALTAITGGADAETALTELGAAQDRLTEANRAAAAVAELNAEVSALTPKLETARARLESTTEAAAAGREELAALESRRADLISRLQQARGESEDVQSRHAQVTAAVEAVTEHEEADRQLKSARERLKRARKAADDAAAAAGFADRKSAAAAALPDRERTALAETIADHDARLARVKALLEELGQQEHSTEAAQRVSAPPAPTLPTAATLPTAKKPRKKRARKADAGQPMLDLWAGTEPADPAPTSPDPTGTDPTGADPTGADTTGTGTTRAEPEAGREHLDLDQLAEALRKLYETARAEHQFAQQRHTLTTRAAQALTKLAAELERHAEATAGLRTSFATLDSMSRCIEGTGGDNQMRMRLSSYVLAARLEQVAQAASVRLAAMSGGRYSLVHTDGPAKGGARTGLGLAVVDGWTGVQRDPSTLSGGETFCTSLALALGLADVVQAEAGGAAIETLLVDEGFGSLDQDTLDEVMDVLDGLRSGGRAVGLVSHVADLRDRIPAQLEVVKGRNGSHLRLGALRPS
ncbi:AAA family ATPase [Kineosporia babensis]|uniref:Nuclease SbcCD subunit C n=1 Tax=Kineosporia babensis TaxID=499548 RepID=A0A9X1NEK6_9ACTN|nr:SMC family ATPase [Kineosporia babensis]MCD5312316.1 AAA family ATPase [Kineosporia babensis]